MAGLSTSETIVAFEGTTSAEIDGSTPAASLNNDKAAAPTSKVLPGERRSGSAARTTRAVESRWRSRPHPTPVGDPFTRLGEREIRRMYEQPSHGGGTEGHMHTTINFIAE